MTLSLQMITGTLGAIALVATTLISAMVRQGDWSTAMEPGAWVTALLVTGFMGLWGFLTLVFSSANTNMGAKRGLLGLAAVYFFVAVFLTADIIINGNSTAGIAFFLYPVFAMPVMLVLILVVTLVGSRLAGGHHDR